MESREEKTNNVPFFSIIIPAYNAQESYFRECMDSLKEQTFGDFEIIVVDDGSRKECADLYDEIASEDERIRVIHQQNQGVSAARNHGIEEARADRIMFVDADDWIDPNTCEVLHDTILAQPCDILMFDHVKDYASGVHKREKTGLTDKTLYSMDDIATKEMFYRRAMGTPNLGAERLSTIYYSVDKVYDRNWLLGSGLHFPVGLPKSEDKVFMLQCFENMRTLYYISAPFYHYRINEQSATYRYSENVDSERRDLAGYLEKTAIRMDAELGALKNDPTYSVIYKNYTRFVFGIISEVLFSKYYHKDYPRTRRERGREVREFLNSEPYRTAIRNSKYSDLRGEAKLKKFMLSHGMTSLFCRMRRAKKKISGQSAG